MQPFGAYLTNRNESFVDADCDGSPSVSDTFNKLSAIVWRGTHLRIRTCKL